ncbi:MAG: hypothetical protein R6V85_11760 [Polyangia bacterium]
MKIESATIEIRPRKTTEMIDLAALFYRRHFALFAGLLAVLGVPCVLLAVAVHAVTGLWWTALAAFWLLSPLPCGAVVLAASRLVFGSSPSVRETLSLYRSLWLGLLLRRLVHNALFALLAPIVVGFTLRLRWAFTPMIVLLERLSGLPLGIRRRGLSLRGGSSGLSMDLASGLVWLAMLLALGSLLDLFVSDLLVLWSNDGMFATDALHDPLRLGLWMLCGLIVLPIKTLSWFFLYIDARIRGEGWDIELGLETAARRIPSREKAVA